MNEVFTFYEYSNGEEGYDYQVEADGRKEWIKV